MNVALGSKNNKKGAQPRPGSSICGSKKTMGQARNWTREEEIYLEEHWGTLPIDTIANNLGRSRDAIIVKAQRLGLGAFLESGDYVTWNQLLKTIGMSDTAYKDISWVRNRGCPVKRQKVGKNTYRVIRLDNFWKWAEKNQGLLDFSKFEENALGKEPGWVKEKRHNDFRQSRRITMTPWTSAEDAKLIRLVKMQKYTFPELSKKLRRTEGAIRKRLSDLGVKEHPVKLDNHTKWTDEEYLELGEMIKAGLPCEEIAEKLNKSTKAVKGRVYAMYLTENFDKARAIMGDGNFGDNRPERKIRHRFVMDPAEKAQAKDLLEQLAGILHHEFKRQVNESEWGEFFQKDMCRNFCGGCLSTPGCDECDCFERIQAQNCKMCGKTFYERTENNFCHSCRDMRRRQYLRKKMALAK